MGSVVCLLVGLGTPFALGASDEALEPSTEQTLTVDGDTSFVLVDDLWQAVDSNRDGSIDPTESRLVPELESQFESLDKNSDQLLDIEEFAVFETEYQSMTIDNSR